MACSASSSVDQPRCFRRRAISAPTAVLFSLSSTLFMIRTPVYISILAPYQWLAYRRIYNATVDNFAVSSSNYPSDESNDVGRCEHAEQSVVVRRDLAN